MYDKIKMRLFTPARKGRDTGCACLAASAVYAEYTSADGSSTAARLTPLMRRLAGR